VSKHWRQNVHETHHSAWAVTGTSLIKSHVPNPKYSDIKSQILTAKSQSKILENNKSQIFHAQISNRSQMRHCMKLWCYLYAGNWWPLQMEQRQKCRWMHTFSGLETLNDVLVLTSVLQLLHLKCVQHPWFAIMWLDTLSFSYWLESQIFVYPMHWIDPLISFFRLCVC